MTQFRISLHSRDITYTHLKESTSYFSFSPRQCFHASHSNSVMVQLKLHVMEKIHPIGPIFNIISFLEQPDMHIEWSVPLNI
jgi:hypothetical protein